MYIAWLKLVLGVLAGRRRGGTSDIAGQAFARCPPQCLPLAHHGAGNTRMDPLPARYTA